MINPGTAETESMDAVGVKVFGDAQSRSIREWSVVEVHRDVPLPEGRLTRMCPVFVQRRKEVAQVEPASAGEGERPITPPMPELDKMMHSPLAFASFSSVQDYRPAGLMGNPPKYRIYVDFVNITVDEHNYADTVRSIGTQFFTAEYMIEGNELTLSVRPEDTEKWSYMQDGQYIAVKHKTAFTMAAIQCLRIDDGRNAMIFEFEDEDKAIEFKDMVHSPAVKYWIPEQSADRAHVSKAISFFGKQKQTLPVFLHGICSPYESIHVLKQYVSFGSIMHGQTYLIVQPTFYDYDWHLGDKMYANLTPVDSGLDTTTRYDITYDPEPRKDCASVYVGLFTNTFRYDTLVCCTVNVPWLMHQSIRFIRQ